MNQKIKLWWKKYWFPFVMNITFILQYGTGYLAEQKVNYYIVLTSIIILWNMMFFITIPNVRQLAYLEGKLDTLKEFQKITEKNVIKKVTIKIGGKKDGGV